MKNRNILIALALSVSLNTYSQDIEHSAQYMKAYPIDATKLTFKSNTDISTRPLPAAPINWGMDVAWNSADNVTRGHNYIGDVLNIGRVSFQPSDLVDENWNLSEQQQKALQSRLNNIAISGVKNIILNCDHEVLTNKQNFPNCDQNYKNYHGKPYEWYRVIKATIRYCKAKGFNVITVSPFNEPDYTAWKEGSKDDFKAICKYISEDSELAGIRISAGNTLNCDQAASWYSYMKPYVTEGNTHQLAGSFDNYANFWKTVASDGNHATADELHNVMEAFVGIHYGMNSGVWWGFEGAARGEFCISSAKGKEIGYAENRNTWTAATVYKREDGRIDAFIGSSERQGKDCNYEIISTDRPVYFDSFGPYYNYFMQIPGGTGYQQNTTNAERLIQVQYGEDVPCEAIGEGEYVIMSAKNSKVIGFPSGKTNVGEAIGLTDYLMTKTGDHQRWALTQVNPRQGTDYSYYIISSATIPSIVWDVRNWGTSVGDKIIGYTGSKGSNEQWILEYAGENNWYIRSRHSGFYLEMSNNSISQSRFTGQKEQQWRFMPTGTSRDLIAPKAPTGLAATPQSASILLSWAANSENDIQAYQVLRAPQGTEDWDVIGRMISGTQFLDNMLSCNREYKYKVMAIDKARNRSVASDIVTAKTTGAKALIAHYSFDTNVQDASENKLNAQSSGTINYSTVMGVRDGSHSLQFSATNKNYLLLPSTVAANDELTIATWVYNLSSTKSWTRIFDFGNGTDQYMFLTPSNGSEMRFVMNNGEGEQILSASKLGVGLHHVAVTIGKESVKIYVDGVEEAESKAFTISPSDLHSVINYVGRSQFASDEIFGGYLDDFRVYNYALNAEDVSDLYNGREVSAIVKVSGDGMSDEAESSYNLAGQKVGKDYRGIVINRGKKIMK